MAPITVYPARRACGRSLRAGLSGDRLSGALASSWGMLVGAHRMLRAAAETVREAQELRREMLQRYPFMDV